MLQWVHGRAAVVMQIPGKCNRFQGKRASMGPRPRGRGDVRLPVPLRRYLVASMGPRPRGRGDGRPPRQRLPWKSRFNGSTAARPW